jgi:DNA-binding beta-propeller fold protein YncE
MSLESKIERKFNGEEGMNKIRCFCITFALAIALTSCGGTQTPGPASAQPTAETEAPLMFTFSVPLKGVEGRFDHFAASKDHVFVSALGNDTVEIIDIFKGTRVHEITGISNPQGIAFSPEANKLFVASEGGKVYIYDGDSFKLLNTLDFDGGADNVRYDAATKRVYVGCGDDEKNSAIAAIDAMSGKRTDEVYKLGAEAESFQLEKSGPNIYVNVPDLNVIKVINRTTKEITQWPVTNRQNFPMALDEADHRLMIGTREAATLTVYDTTTGKVVASVPTIQDTDDMYYSADKKRVIVPGRGGAIWVYQQTDPDRYTLISKVPTVVGAGTAGYFGRQGKGFERMYVAVPATANSNAEIRIYTLS